MNLTDITTTHDGQQVVNGMSLTKALIAETGADKMAVFRMVGKSAQHFGAEVLLVGAKGDEGAYRLADAERIAILVPQVVAEAARMRAALMGA